MREGRLQGWRRPLCGTGLAGADHVFVAAPLTPTSLHLLNSQTLAHSEPGQFIVNVGRGAVVDDEAIADSLDAGRLAGYAATCSPSRTGRCPSSRTRCLSGCAPAPRTLLTPHLGWAVSSVRLVIEHRAADNIIAVLRGKAPGDAINRPPTARGRMA